MRREEVRYVLIGAESYAQIRQEHAMVGKSTEMILELFFKAFLKKKIQRTYHRGHFRVGIKF